MSLFGQLAGAMVALRDGGTVTPGDGPAVPYAGRAASWWNQAAGSTGQAQQLAAMGGVGTLFAVVNRTSTSTASASWYLERTQAKRTGRPVEPVQVPSHPALALWEQPNAWMPQQELVEISQQHLDLAGAAIWVLTRTSPEADPVAIWPVRPDRMAPIPDDEVFLAGWVYSAPDGTKIRLDAADVVWTRTPDPSDIYGWMSPVQAIMADLDSVRYAAQWSRNFFINSAEPGGVIEMPDGLSDAQFKQFMDRWHTSHRGVANAHRVAVIERGKWVPRAYSMRDMQFTELRRLSRDVVLEAYGMAKATLGITDDVNRAAALAAEHQFARWLVQPRLERWRSTLNHDLLPRFRAPTDGVRFEFVSPLPEDREADDAERASKAGSAAALVSAGWHPDDVLQTVGLPPMRWVGQAADADQPAGPVGVPGQSAALRAALAGMRSS